MESVLSMAKQEFKKRWESDDAGGGISFEDVANCAKAWGIASYPRTMRLELIRYLVLKAAGVKDAEEYAPEEEDEDEYE